MAVVITIGGVDRTSVVRLESLVIEQDAASFISICSLTVSDAAGTIAIAAESAITVVDGATTYFSGRVVDVTYTPLTQSHREIHLQCQDLNWQLLEHVVDSEHIFTATKDGNDGGIIDQLFDAYLNTVVSDDDALNQIIDASLTITLGPCTLASALNQICTRTGGYFYIDFANKLHYFAAEASGVAWHLSDTPDDVNSFGYLVTPEPVMESTATTRLDGVFVVGAGVDGWRGTHAVGDRQAIVRDNRITTATGVADRGDAILTKYGDAQVTYTVTTYKAGLRAGMDVRFVCALYGEDATFDVRRVVVRWDRGGRVYFTLTLGAPASPSLVGQRTMLEAMEQSLEPISAPRLPTSSKGWSHNLVFTATDNDTVAWADAGVITLADGTSYTISPAANTGNMAAITYIYLDIDTSTTALQTTTNAATAVGEGKILIAVAENVADATKLATFQIFGGEGQGLLITQPNIAALSVTTNEIAANTILAGNIAAGTITTNEIAANTILAGNIAANTITADKINMGIGDGLFNAADGLLLLGPHCEINTTEWWTARKQKATLSGAFHQEAGRWLGTRGLVVEEATTNLIKEPSFETALVFWGGVGATATADATYSVFGDYALKLVTDNLAAGEGDSYNCTDTTAAATEYTLSVYMRGSGTVVMGFWDAGAGFQDSSVITLTNVWTRYELTATFGAGAARMVYVWTDVQQGITFYCDGFQLEQQDYATSYCDGTLGTGYAWTGAAHGSTSTRTATEVNLDAHVGLISGVAALSFRVVAQTPYDYDAASPAYGRLFEAWEDADNRVLLYYNPATNTLALIWEESNIQVPLSWEADFSAGDWLDIVAVCDTAGDLELWVNGDLKNSTDLSARSPIAPSQWNIGTNQTATYPGGFIFAEYAVFDRVLTAIEVAGLYAMTRPMIDMGALDKPGIYILDGAFKIASSTSGNRIDISADEIAGYDSGGTKQFYLQSSDGTAYAGAGAVVLDADGLRVTGTGGVADNTRRIIFNYDSAGTEYLISGYYGDWGGAGRAVTWVQSWCAAGDPWAAAGSSIVLAALDTNAGDDTRISIESSGLISVGGTQFQLAATTKLHLDGAEIEFDAATGSNLIEIKDDLADALHVSSNQPMEFLRFVTTNGSESIAVDPAAAGINFGIGMIPTANGVVSIKLSTENLEIIDAGSAGATEQDWIEVEIGGVQGFLHVFAAV